MKAIKHTKNYRQLTRWLTLALLFNGTYSLGAEHTLAKKNAEIVHTQEISIGNFTFQPTTLEVNAGTLLSWVNEDDVPHVVIGTDADSPLRSPPLDTNDRYAVTIDKPGVYKYFCSLHPHMIGTVIVK